jgi:HD-like signal output (HDOD) protein
LFRSIGKLALEKLGAEGEPLPGYQPDRDSDLVLWEKHTFGTSANGSTAVILKHWHFPPEIANTISQHFTPLDHNRLTHLLNLAANVAESRGYGLPGEQRYWLDSETAHRELGIDERYSQRYIDRAIATFERVKRAFT